VPVAAARVLREMFGQFTHTLVTLQHADDPELVHQARVGWRRFRSGLKLFKKTAWVQTIPVWQDLRPLLHALGGLRDLDVANLETLPMLANAYAAGDGTRQAHWRAMQESLAQAADQQRQVVRAALNDPATGANLLALTEWLESGFSGDFVEEPAKERKTTLRRWAQRRIARLREQLKISLKNVDQPESAHRARILSKRLRYGIEALRPLLPKRRAHRWYQQAIQLQGDMGAERDLQQAVEIVARLQAHTGLQEFLRGVQARMTQAR
jgi:CHAD domain-containing protein